MLNINNLSLSLNNQQILKSLDLSIAKGETLSIIGPSGCGKSSLLLTLANIYKSFTGDITFKGNNISLILQTGGLFPWKTALDNILLSMENINLPAKEKVNKINALALELNIQHLLHKFPTQLSGGEKQRVAVCRSLISNPDLLLLDEPSSALDSINKDIFQELLLRLQKVHNLTYILVTHNIEEAIYLGKKIAIMSNGEIKKVINNDFFGNENRNSIDFFNKTQEIKNILKQFVDFN